MTRLEDFTKAAMVAILSNPSMIDNSEDGSVEWLVRRAVIVAKAQLKELKEQDND
jgi:hypothetical protein